MRPGPTLRCALTVRFFVCALQKVTAPEFDQKHMRVLACIGRCVAAFIGTSQQDHAVVVLVVATDAVATSPIDAYTTNAACIDVAQ